MSFVNTIENKVMPFIEQRAVPFVVTKAAPVLLAADVVGHNALGLANPATRAEAIQGLATDALGYILDIALMTRMQGRRTSPELPQNP